MACNLICERFLRNIVRWYGRTRTGARSWKGPKDNVYDDRVYDMRVLRLPGSLTDEEKKNYRRCGVCQIIISKFKKCPCCGNVQLSLLPYSPHKIADKKGVLKRY